MLVESISGLEESQFSLEVIWESSRAVVTFKQPAGRKGQERTRREPGDNQEITRR